MRRTRRPRIPLWIVAGFSQGSGHASYIAKDQMVARVIFFSSGADTIADVETMTWEAAPWCLEPRVTPLSRHFGLLHERDSYELKSDMYLAYGMDRYGGFVNVDSTAPPHGYSHMLTTNATPEGGDTSFHQSLASDPDVPLGQDGLPLMKDAHYYMMTGPIPDN